jgi:hypothetical protein
MAQALARHVGDVEYLGPMPSWPLGLGKRVARARQALGLPRGHPAQTMTAARAYARAARRRLSELEPAADVVFCPAGSVMLGRLETESPVVYSSDATVRRMLGYYPQFTGLPARTVRVAESLERAAIERADLLLYPTRWAADSAITDYGADPERVLVAPYGANLLETPVAVDPAAREGAAGRPCRLLMVGVSWEIKGGAIAVEALRSLRAGGVDAELTVVGCTPPQPIDEPGLHLVGFLDKDRSEDRERLHDLYRAADFFLLPSRSECYGIVFCEAAAHGLPAVATRTGGVPEVVREGVNGHTVPHDDLGPGYAEAIAELWSDQPRYQALRVSSRQEFETRLNWDVWAQMTGAAMAEVIQVRDGRSESSA